VKASGPLGNEETAGKGGRDTRGLLSEVNQRKKINGMTTNGRANEVENRQKKQKNLSARGGMCMGFDDMYQGKSTIVLGVSKWGGNV